MNYGHYQTHIGLRLLVIHIHQELCEGWPAYWNLKLYWMVNERKQKPRSFWL